MAEGTDGKTTFKGIAACIAAMAMFVVNDTMIKQTLDDLHLYEAVFLRGLFGCIVISSLAMATGTMRSWRMAMNVPITLRSLAEFGSISTFFVALTYLSIADVTAVSQTAPLMIVPLAAILYGEKVGIAKWLAVFAGFGGALLIAKPGGSGFNPMIGFAFLAAIAITIRDLLSRRVPTGTPAPIVALSTILVVTVLSGIMTLLWGFKVPTLHLVLLIMVAGVMLAGAHTLMFYAYSQAPASTIAPFTYAATFWAFLSSSLVFGESIDSITMLGLLVLVISGAWLAWASRSDKL